MVWRGGQALAQEVGVKNRVALSAACEILTSCPILASTGTCGLYARGRLTGLFLNTLMKPKWL